MVNQRDRIEKLTEYIENNGIDLNIGKNKARGNKGLFAARGSRFRIDIAKNTDSVLSTLLHEFAHFIHYKYDKTLKSLDYIFPNINDEMLEELINLSVQFVPKETAQNLFSQKEIIRSEIKVLSNDLKKIYPEFCLSKPLKKIENSLKIPEKYLLKYDRVKYFNHIFSISNLDNYDLKKPAVDYIIIKSKQRLLKRVNSRIEKLNRYYNEPTELTARFVEMYYIDNTLAQKLAPKCCEAFNNNNLEEFANLNKIFA